VAEGNRASRPIPPGPAAVRTNFLPEATRPAGGRPRNSEKRHGHNRPKATQGSAKNDLPKDTTGYQPNPISLEELTLIKLTPLLRGP